MVSQLTSLYVKINNTLCNPGSKAESVVLEKMDKEFYSPSQNMVQMICKLFINESTTWNCDKHRSRHQIHICFFKILHLSSILANCFAAYLNCLAWNESASMYILHWLPWGQCIHANYMIQFSNSLQQTPIIFWKLTKHKTTSHFVPQILQVHPVSTKPWISSSVLYIFIPVLSLMYISNLSMYHSIDEVSTRHREWKKNPPDQLLIPEQLTSNYCRNRSSCRLPNFYICLLSQHLSVTQWAPVNRHNNNTSTTNTVRNPIRYFVFTLSSGELVASLSVHDEKKGQVNNPIKRADK